MHGLNLEGARVTEAYLYGAEISGDIEGLRLNRVDVEPAGHGVSFGGRYRRGPSKGCAG